MTTNALLTEILKSFPAVRLARDLRPRNNRLELNVQRAALDAHMSRYSANIHTCSGAFGIDLGTSQAAHDSACHLPSL